MKHQNKPKLERKWLKEDIEFWNNNHDED